ncbi:hypothetical protein HBI95_163550 [Parastagonospora nodorum]|nr:hypothetical protein HBI09_205910 [Parastagonospora nodorum]KAH4201816.1 hypothetical protein HBI95_163550 [Parastagonospora nodorum]KAH4978872.1 hypothetical protein HBI77_224120 [Parastagonospora nodorum]KAH5177866.1 hypothetical protein HBH77_194380 [Parastagonospora nodorum]KAH5744379.1 hypothetical protein HBI17_153920 [Parastagonospora nodorum]
MVTTRRKAAEGQEGASKKAKKDVPAKATSEQKAPTKLREEDSPPPTQSDGDEEKREVQWAQPTQGQGNHHRDQGEAVTRFSQTLFDQPWTEIWTAQRPFKFPALRTPLYRSRSGVDLTAEKQPHFSAPLRQLFNLIKNTTQGNAVEERIFTEHAFRQAFHDTNNIAAVIASGSTASPILALDRDYRVDITVGEGDAAETGHVLFLHRSPALDKAEASENDYGYFIELPPNTQITVNGITYINDTLEAEQGPSAPSPFIIGTLDRYTIIELLSQPIFFFRTQADLEFTAKIKDNVANRPSGAEMNRRHQLGEDAADHIDITCTPLDERRKSPEDVSPRKSATPNIEFEYDDTWVADTNAREYVEDAIHDVFRDRYQDLIPRVLASINDRQGVEAGFSIDSDEEVQRPGRTMITTMQYAGSDHTVLLIYRIGEGRAISLQVLDSMAWSSTPAHRQRIHESALQILVDRNWWRGTFESADEMQLQFPEASYWVDCVQHDIPRRADTYAILNAFAIAMGLQLNLNFYGRRPENFFDQAQLIFESLLSDQLDWKVLYAFFTSTKYAGRVVDLDDEAEHNEDEGRYALPPVTRRFNLRVRPYGELVRRQRDQDSAALGMRNEADVVLASDHMELDVEDGSGHNTEFPHDSCEPGFRNDTLRRVAIDGGWALKTSLEIVEEWYREEGLASPPSYEEQGEDPGVDSNEDPPADEDPPAGDDPSTDEGSPAQSKPALQGPHFDHYDVAESFNPCEYFRKRIATLLTSTSIKATLADPPTTQALGSRMASLHILQVLRALNEVFPDGQGFSFYEPEEKMLMTSLVDRMGDVGDKSPAPIDPGAYHDRVVLSPRRIGNHRVLLLLQFTLNDTDTAVTIHVLDSAEGKLSKEQRQELFDSIDRMRDSDPVMPRSIMWIFGPQQQSAWQIDYFTVLNAWSTLLGLDLNQHFSLEGKPNFFTEIKQLLQAAAAGQADWKLIWAFLRCSNYVVGTEPPPLNRRFTRTIPMTDLRRYRRVLDERLAPHPFFEDPGCFHPKLDEIVGVRHDVDFPRDGRAGKAPETQNSTAERNGETGDKPAVLLSDREKRNMELGLEPDFDPCSYFHEQRNKILAGSKDDLEDFRQREVNTCTRKFRAWLDDTETSLAIAAVTMRLTRSQGATQGFSYASAHEVASCFEGEAELIATFRPGCPMILPLHIERHFVLLIIRLDAQGRPEFSVMDSKPYYLGRKNRANIHDMMFRLIRDTKWWNLWSKFEDLGSNRPQHTSWLPSATQPSDNECGYYVILNAWSIALGLETNPDVCLDWSDTFFRDLQDVIHLARIGRASSKFIYAFLRCYGYVKEGKVSSDRQFDSTLELRNEIDMSTFADDFHMDDAIQFSITSELLWQDLGTKSVLHLPGGARRHNDAAAFPSDRWDENTRHLAVELGRRGKLNLDHTAREVGAAIQEGRKERGRHFMEQLKTSGIDCSTGNRSQILQACRDHLDGWHSQHTNILRADPCEISIDTIAFYKHIFKKDTLGDVFQGDAFQVWPDDHSATMKEEVVSPMDEIQVNLPISAVVEAIDRLQERHRTNTGGVFAGGFSLSVSYNNGAALHDPPTWPVTAVSRPRRCFLMPLYIGDALAPALREWQRQNKVKQSPKRPGAGHHLLAVVQEEEETDTNDAHFDICLYDSSRHVFANSEVFLIETITGAIRQLEWSTHRNGSDGIPILYTPSETIPVPQQAAGGGWRCGPHTITNAWILAMGLTPNPEADYSDAVYGELRVLARAAVAGLLDWQALVAWFFCRRLTLERSLDYILPDRRFTTTHFWESEAKLSERINNILDGDDEILSAFPIDEFVYDHGNNVQHGRSVQVVDDTTDDEDGDRDDDDKDEGLSRHFEEVDSPYNRLNRKRRSATKQTTPDALAFLNRYDVDVDGDVIMSERSHQAFSGRKGEVDNLVFLEGF